MCGQDLPVCSRLTDLTATFIVVLRIQSTLSANERFRDIHQFKDTRQIESVDLDWCGHCVRKSEEFDRMVTERRESKFEALLYDHRECLGLHSRRLGRRRD